jgi:Na+-transporting NADH:ubiquinone oxidoreductase subunit F
MISTFQSKLLSKMQLASNIIQLTFAPIQHEFSFSAGQYVILHIPQKDSTSKRRLYSIASSQNNAATFELIIELVKNGIASAHLSSMAIGDNITTQGPAGLFTLPSEPQNCIFFATGTGISPIRSMIRKLIDDEFSKDITLYWGFPHIENVYLLDELEKLAQENPNFMFYNCISRDGDLSLVTEKRYEKFFELGRINEVFEKTLLNATLTSDFFLCGSPKIIDSLKEFLVDKGVPKERIHFEKFSE